MSSSSDSGSGLEDHEALFQKVQLLLKNREFARAIFLSEALGLSVPKDTRKDRAHLSSILGNLAIAYGKLGDRARAELLLRQTIYYLSRNVGQESSRSTTYICV